MTRNPLAIAISAIVAIIIAAGGAVLWTLRLAVAPRRRIDTTPTDTTARDERRKQEAERITERIAEDRAAIQVSVSPALTDEEYAAAAVRRGRR